MVSTNQSRFRKITFITIIAVYLLILVGGIVRSLGAGMGCPDWPMCFGQVIPPVSVKELPENYQETFLVLRLKKNERLAATLSGLGFKEIANKISNDPSILEEEDFHVTKAWIEYINRLVGVVIGFLIMLTTFFSFSYSKQNRTITILSLCSLLLVLFQGWVGSLVVSTNLLPGFVTIHLFLALLLIAILLYVYYLAVDNGKLMKVDKRIFMILVISLVLLLPQFLMGTSIRGEVDSLLHNQLERASVVEYLSINFYIHRTYSLIFLACFVYLFIYFNTHKLLDTTSGKLIKLAAICVLIEIIGGAVMAYFSIPFFVQPIHLLASVILFGSIFYLVLLTKNRISPIA